VHPFSARRHSSGPHREFPALPEEVVLQILHPFAGSIQHYAEEIAVYHRPALADDACKLTTPGSISFRQIFSSGASHTASSSGMAGQPLECHFSALWWA
jgi:hypothetical protein